MFQLRVARTQQSLDIHVMDEDAALFRRHSFWDTCLVDGVIVLSPSVGPGPSCFLHWDHMPGQRYCIRFCGQQCLDIPLFGIFDTEAHMDDDGVLRIAVEAVHLMPWIKPFRPASWSQEQAAEMIFQRVNSALLAGHKTREVLRVIAIPDCVREHILPATWSSLLDELRQMENT